MLRAQSDSLERDRERLVRYLPDDLPRRLREGATGPERRWLTVAAIDIEAFTAHLERLAPEDLVRVLDDVYGLFADLGRRPVVGVARFKAHDPHPVSAQALHAGYRSPHFVQGDLEGISHPFGPVHDGGTEAIDAHPGTLQGLDHFLERGLGQVMEIGLRPARHLHVARFDMTPAQLQRGRYL